MVKSEYSSSSVISVPSLPIVQRILFLETIAGVPGMVAAMLRHLSSLRLMVSQTSFLTVTFLII